MATQNPVLLKLWLIEKFCLSGHDFDEYTSKIDGLQNYWLLFDSDWFLPEHDIYLGNSDYLASRKMDRKYKAWKIREQCLL